MPTFAAYNTNIPNACSTDFAHELIAVYKPNIYTCLPGYYLPANHTTCEPCPSGFTCNGGQFVFDPKTSHGNDYKKPIKQNANGACAINTGHELIAIYKPNTITINWDDGTNTVQNTCTYGQSITLPPTPVRPGYVFGGWRVKNQ